MNAPMNLSFTSKIDAGSFAFAVIPEFNKKKKQRLKVRFLQLVEDVAANAIEAQSALSRSELVAMLSLDTLWVESQSRRHTSLYRSRLQGYLLDLGDQSMQEIEDHGFTAESYKAHNRLLGFLDLSELH